MEIEAAELQARIAELDRLLTAPAPDYDPAALAALRLTLADPDLETVQRLLRGLVDRIIVDRDGQLVTGELIYYSPPT